MSDRFRELSARGPGAITVLVLEGPRATAALRRLAPAARLAPGAIELVRLVDAGEALDEALVCTRAADQVELHVHGSPPLVARLRAYFERELGPARAGAERHPSIERRAWARLAGAASEAGARILLDQAQGALRAELCSLEAEGDEARARSAQRLLARGHAARFALEPATVVLAGPVNAGKSTLFNALVGARRAIVSEQPGTTRDLVEERGRLGAWPVTWIDSAGEREASSDDPEQGIERAGQRRAREARSRCDLVLRLEPCSGDPVRDAELVRAHETTSCVPHELATSERPLRQVVRLLTCGDRLAPALRDAGPRARRAPVISALHAPEAARETVLELFLAALSLPREPWVPGAGAPFEREQRVELARLSARGGSADPEGRWRSWLARELAVEREDEGPLEAPRP